MTSMTNGPDDAASRSFADVIADTLRGWMLDGRLLPGQPIRQAAVAEEIGASRVPVREALRQLVAEGLVELEPNRGARVASLDLEECKEAYAMRRALEPLAIRHSAPNLTAAQLATLKQMIERMDSARQPREILDADRAFHLLTYAGAGMPRLLRTIESLWTSTQPYRAALLQMLTEEEMAYVQDLHRLILRSLEIGDAEDAARLLESHIHRGSEQLTQHPALFAPPRARSTRPRGDALATGDGRAS